MRDRLTFAPGSLGSPRQTSTASRRVTPASIAKRLFQPSRHFANRKNRVPAGAVMVMLLTEALLVIVKPEAVQFEVLRLVF